MALVQKFGLYGLGILKKPPTEAWQLSKSNSGKCGGRLRQVDGTHSRSLMEEQCHFSVKPRADPRRDETKLVQCRSET